MRFFALVGPLVALALSVSAQDAAKRAIIDLATESASLDLSGATPQLHIVRTDSLIDTEGDGKPLAERITHVGISVSVDVAQAALRIGDQLIPLLGGESPVVVTRTDALRINEEVASSMVSVEQVQALASHMSPGIVSLEVRVESELMDAVPALAAKNEDGSISAMLMENMRFRRVAVFVKLHEVEGVDMAHTKSIFVPLLQLVVQSNNGNELVAVKTIMDEAPEMQPGHVQAANLPAHEGSPKTWAREGLALADAEKGDGRHHRHHHKHHGSGRHGRGRPFCFFRRMGRRIRHAFMVVFNSMTAWVIAINATVFFGTLLIKRIVSRRRSEPVNEDEEVEKKMADQMVYVDQLPTYEASVPTPVVIVVAPEDEKKAPPPAFQQ